MDVTHFWISRQDFIPIADSGQEISIQREQYLTFDDITLYGHRWGSNPTQWSSPWKSVPWLKVLTGTILLFYFPPHFLHSWQWQSTEEGMCDLLSLSDKQTGKYPNLISFGVILEPHLHSSAFLPSYLEMKSLDQGCTNQQNLRANPRAGENLPAAKVAYKKEGEKLLRRQGQGGMVLK